MASWPLLQRHKISKKHVHIIQGTRKKSSIFFNKSSRKYGNFSSKNILIVRLIYCPPKAGFPVAVTAAAAAAASKSVCVCVRIRAWIRAAIKEFDWRRYGSDGPGVAGLNDTSLKIRAPGSQRNRGIWFLGVRFWRAESGRPERHNFEK